MCRGEKIHVNRSILMSHHCRNNWKISGHSFAGTCRPRWPFMHRTVRLCQGCSRCRPPGVEKESSPGQTVHWRMCVSAILHSCSLWLWEENIFFLSLALTSNLIPNPLFPSSPICVYKDCHLLFKASYVKVILIICDSLHCALLVVGKEVVERRERTHCLQSGDWRVRRSSGPRAMENADVPEKSLSKLPAFWACGLCRSELSKGLKPAGSAQEFRVSKGKGCPFPQAREI